MDIALCTDNNFVIPALICITSIFENNKDTDCHLFVLTDSMTEAAQEKFSLLAKTYGQSIKVMTVDKRRVEHLISNERFPISMYYRFFLPEMLPQTSCVLYLDCDIIVRKSLKELFKTKMENKALAAVVGESCDDIYFVNHLQLSKPYFNSGVLYMNLDYWRKNNITHKLIHWIADNPDLCALPDQDALNKVLEGKVAYLDYTYNYQEWWTRPSLVPYMHYSKWEEIRRVGKDPTIIHFCEAEKPWFKECKNPFQKDFLYYANLHSFIGFQLRSRYGFAYKCAKFIDRVGLKIRYWAERWEKHIVKNIRIS